MKNISTPVTNSSQANQKEVSPRKSTIEFIRQFARAYNHVPELHPALSGVIAN